MHFRRFPPRKERGFSIGRLEWERGASCEARAAGTGQVRCSPHNESVVERKSARNEKPQQRGSLESVRTPWPTRRDRLSRLLRAFLFRWRKEMPTADFSTRRQGRRFYPTTSEWSFTCADHCGLTKVFAIATERHPMPFNFFAFNRRAWNRTHRYSVVANLSWFR